MGKHFIPTYPNVVTSDEYGLTKPNNVSIQLHIQYTTIKQNNEKVYRIKSEKLS